MASLLHHSPPRHRTSTFSICRKAFKRRWGQPQQATHSINCHDRPGNNETTASIAAMLQSKMRRDKKRQATDDFKCHHPTDCCSRKKRRPEHAATCSHLHGSVRHVVLLNQAFVHRVATTANTGGFGTCTSHNQPPHPHPSHAFDCCLQLQQTSPSATITT